MAYGIIHKPGSEHGPCATPCRHQDCAETYRMAESRCSVCSEVIGYDVKWSYDAAGAMAHYACVLRAADDLRGIAREEPGVADALARAMNRARR